MNDFWARKKQELQGQGKLPQSPQTPVTQGGAWWQETSPVVPQDRPGSRTEAHVRQASAVNANKANCPSCGGSNYMKPSPSVSSRCFECGYVDGRQLNEPNLPGIAGDAATIKVKQIPTQGHFGQTLAEIGQNNAALEQSAQGRTRLS